MPSRLSVVGILLACLGLSHAFVAFQPTCDVPSEDDRYDYVLSTQVRGTMDIIWSCFAVMLLCTWSIQHLAVPDPRQSAKERHKVQKNTAVEDQKKGAKSIRRRVALMILRNLAKIFGAEKTSWLWEEFLDECHWNLLRLEGMALCIMAPEYYLGKAFAENSSANASRAQFKDEENWSTAHAFFADMRGFIMKFETTAVETSLVPSKSKSDDGRNRHRTYPGGKPTPYVEQNEKEAIERELKDCETLHGEHCPYRLEKGRTEGAEPKSGYQGNKVQEPGPNAVPNEPRATDKIGMTEVLTPLDVINLPKPLHTLSPELPEDFSCQTTAVASPGSQRGWQWWKTSSGLPSTIEKKESKPHSSQKSPSGSQPQPQPQSQPPRQPSSHTKPSEQLLPHPTWTGYWSLSSLQMYYAAEIGLIPKQPYISRKALKDQSKTDGLVKTLALWQLLWLTTQVLARAATNLPISQLEITVLAFSALSMLTYVLLWHKPQDVRCPSYVSAQRPLTRSDVLKLAARAPVSTLLVHEFWLHGVNVRAMGDSVFPWPRGIRVSLPNLPGRGSKLLSFEMDSVFFGMGIGGAVFGAIHFAAWNFAFPTPVERLLWRISCGIIVGFPILMSAIYVLYLKWAEGAQDQREGGGDSWTNRVLRRFGHVLVPVYLLARLYLLVEVFRSLAYSPPAIFQSIAWPTMVPHYS